MKFFDNKFILLATLAFLILAAVVIFFFERHVSNRDDCVFNVPYHMVRPLILEKGWKPVVSEVSETEGFLVQGYRDLGFPEVEDCSGTGMGYCLFVFENDNGVYLKVTTQEAPFGNVRPRFEKTYSAFVINYGITDTP